MNALELDERIAREVTQPRTKMVGLDLDIEISKCLQIVEETTSSRLPPAKTMI